MAEYTVIRNEMSVRAALIVSSYYFVLSDYFRLELVMS